MSLDVRQWHWLRRIRREVCARIALPGGMCGTCDQDMPSSPCDLNGDWMHRKMLVAEFSTQSGVQPRVCCARPSSFFAAWEDRCTHDLWSCDSVADRCSYEGLQDIQGILNAFKIAFGNQLEPSATRPWWLSRFMGGSAAPVGGRMTIQLTPPGVIGYDADGSPVAEIADE